MRGGLAAALALTSVACAGATRSDEAGPRRLHAVTGDTMGTTFTVQVVADASLDRAALERAITDRLWGIERRMSHYRADSEVSDFNRAPTTDPYPMSSETLGVLAVAVAISRVSDGAFDVTVAPLVDAWGFGPPGRAVATPAGARLDALRARVGYTRLAIDLERSTLRKARPDVTIDLSAIAKGYAVDAVAMLLSDRGLPDHLVEIGGELWAGGANERGGPWRVAIERPGGGLPSVQRVVSIRDRAVATSGDYRNAYALDGSRVSHTIDPRTGYPVTHGLASATVIADRCIDADGRATALEVLGLEEGYRLAVAQEWAALLVARDDAGRLIERATPAFAALAGDPPPPGGLE